MHPYKFQIFKLTSCLIKKPWAFKINAKSVVSQYPTGQKYLLELMFTKLASAKIVKYLDRLKLLPTGGSCLETTLSYLVALTGIQSCDILSTDPTLYQLSNTGTHANAKNA